MCRHFAHYKLVKFSNQPQRFLSTFIESEESYSNLSVVNECINMSLTTLHYLESMGAPCRSDKASDSESIGPGPRWRHRVVSFRPYMTGKLLKNRQTNKTLRNHASVRLSPTQVPSISKFQNVKNSL